MRVSRHGANIHIKRGPCPEIQGSPSFRSGMERNCYRVLLKMYPGISVLYESKRFDFPKPYRCRHMNYLPDFMIQGDGEAELYFESKGWFTGESKSKLMGFKKFFPLEFSKLIVITSGKANINWVQKHVGFANYMDYDRIRKDMAGLVPWEGR